MRVTGIRAALYARENASLNRGHLVRGLARAIEIARRLYLRRDCSIKIRWRRLSAAGDARRRKYAPDEQ